ncbi:MAG: type I polyketide synthase, partial [Chloroflexi bacterium]|nr:type I polyketide synthase [Chloroflexota bacterium]
MVEQPTSAASLSALKRAFQAIEQMQSQLDTIHYKQHEPIAIIGMSCRFPGPKGSPADTPAKFWQNLRNGVDAIIEVPPDRWAVDAYYDPDADVPGKTYTRHGGFLEQIDHFDPAFFGLSPREVTAMDPQHRLLLENSWEALEYANLVPAALFNAPVGVFLGYAGSDYMQLSMAQGAPDLYAATGAPGSTAAGRISYLLGLTGPCFAVDTACSSSLTAIHLACQSLRKGECEAALAGGVGLILNPDATIAFSKGRMLASDGRCKAFDAAADGYIRGEGCGIIVLKRLSDAQAAGDNILAVIRGTAINQDGPSGGLTVPNGPSQERVIKSALADAQLSPAAVSYIEAHGTGTPLGDPIESGALSAVFGQRTEPLYVGSVKTNVGHLEVAAGIVGLLKVVLSLQAEEIPPHLHFHTPSPHIDWQAASLQVPTTLTAWPRGAATSDKTPVNPGERVAGLSSFGFSGTNVHLVIGEAPLPSPANNAVDASHYLLTLSAKNEPALREYAQRYQTFLKDQLTLDHRGVDLGDLCYTAHVGRSHFTHRLSVVADSSATLQAQLAAYVDGKETVGLSQASVFPWQTPPQLAFLFTGQGSQYSGMGRELYESQPTFRATLDRCDVVLRESLGRSLIELLYPT